MLLEYVVGVEIQKIFSKEKTRSVKINLSCFIQYKFQMRQRVSNIFGTKKRSIQIMNHIVSSFFRLIAKTSDQSDRTKIC